MINVECYYYIEELPGVKLDDCYIKPMCKKCQREKKADAWHYYGPLPARLVKCGICDDVIYDGRVKYEDTSAIQDTRGQVLPSELGNQPFSSQLREHGLR